jgi:hypothetical protein
MLLTAKADFFFSPSVLGRGGVMSENAKLVFYHLPKTAGTSVAALWKTNKLATQAYGKVLASLHIELPLG